MARKDALSVDVSAGWRLACELAWESYRRGSPGVGAVIVDTSGSVVASGRSRRGEPPGEANQLAGSRLAHAEVNALAQLGVDHHAGLTVLVTLEPCVLCTVSTAMAHVPRLVFAGVDPVWSYARDLAAGHPHLRERWPSIEGPLPGRLGMFGSLVPLLERLERKPAGDRVAAYERERPELSSLARALVTSGHNQHLKRLPFEDVIDELWSLLPAP